MFLPKRILLLLFLLTSSLPINSYANIITSTINSTTAPPAKKNPIKRKKQKKRKRVQKRSLLKKGYKKTSFRIGRNNSQHLVIEEESNEIIGLGIVVLLLLLVMGSLFLIGGLVGGIGWFIVGAIMAIIWLFFAYLIIFPGAYLDGLGGYILWVSFAIFLSLFILAIVSSLSLLLIFSSIFGGIALIGGLIHLFIKLYYG